jgi:hypothetical protein
VTWWRRIGRWLADRREQRRARALLRSLFDQPDLLAKTSLRRDHRGRAVYLRHERDEAGQVARVTFGIVRHPRPYPFSRQFHEVLEFWTFDVARRTVQRDRGVNLSRVKDSDGEPSSFGAGI